MVSLELLVARSAEAAVVGVRIAAYRDEFELTVNSHLHRSVRSAGEGLAHHPMWHDMGEPGEPIPAELLRFGLARPDGGRSKHQRLLQSGHVLSLKSPPGNADNA